MITHNFILINADTDSVTIGKPNGIPFSEEERINLINEINGIMPEKINFSDDGYFEKVIILKAKNYILQQNGKISKKGSSLKSSKIEPRLKAFMSEIIDCLLTDNQASIIDVYNKYVLEIHNLKDISGWCSKKTVTQSVLNPERTNEQKVLDALNGAQVQMGDKIYVYFAEKKTVEKVARHRTNKKTGIITTTYVDKEIIENPLCLKENWRASEPNHSVSKLVQRIYNTLAIFKNVIKIEDFPKYHLKGNRDKLSEMVND